MTSHFSSILFEWSTGYLIIVLEMNVDSFIFWFIITITVFITKHKN